jgi:hypothetical protein
VHECRKVALAFYASCCRPIFLYVLLRARYLSSGDGNRTAYGYRQPVMAQKILQASREAESALENALLDSPASVSGKIPCQLPKTVVGRDFVGKA